MTKKKIICGQKKFFFEDVSKQTLNPFKMCLFGAAQGCGGLGGVWESKRAPPAANVCYTYHTVIKLGADVSYLKQIQKLYKSPETPFDFGWYKDLFIRY